MSEIERPSNSPDDDALDQALRQWAAGKTAGPHELSSLQKQIQNGLRDRQYAHIELPVQPRSQQMHHQRVVMILAAAASILIAAGVYWVFGVDRSGTPVAKDRTDDERVVLALARGDIDAQQTLLNRYQEVYGPEMSWVSDVDGKLKVQLDDNAIGNRTRFVAIRLALVSRNTMSSDSNWQLLHSANLISGQEQLVEIPVNGSAIQLSVWAFPVDHGLVTVDSRYQSSLPISIDVTASELQKNGESQSIFSVIKNGVEYRLYQTAVRLDQLSSETGRLDAKLNRGKS